MLDNYRQDKCCLEQGCTFYKETTGVCRQWQKLVNCLTCLWLELFCYFLRLMTVPVVSLGNGKEKYVSHLFGLELKIIPAQTGN